MRTITTGGPRRDLRAVVREECANWNSRDGECLWGHSCHVLGGQRCTYFERAVLPAWPNVAAEYKRATAQSHLVGIMVQENSDSG